MLPRLLPRLAALVVLGLVAPLLTTTTATGHAATASATASAATAAAAPAKRKIQYAEWRGPTLAEGRFVGTVLRKARIRIGQPVATRTYGGTTYDVGRWVSPWHEPGFHLTELIASWQAATPRNSWIEVEVRGRTAQGRRSSWDTLGRWAAGDRHVRRTSVGGQGDDLADVNVDTWQVPGGVKAWQVRVNLMRAGRARPSVGAVGAVASRLPDVDDVATSRRGVASGRNHVVLDVPRYSQMVHSGHYPAWGGGGQAWCSPTSLSMVLGYHDALPPASAYSWVPNRHRQPWVDHAARMTFDRDYDGTGNWPFNTAYAGSRLGSSGSAYVTRLRSLRQAERFVARGIPLVASISFGPGELDGAPISSTNGHLLVIVGFTRSGDVVVNDPAARRSRGVRRTYDRGQFEDAWLPTSGGLVYVVTRDAG